MSLDLTALRARHVLLRHGVAEINLTFGEFLEDNEFGMDEVAEIAETLLRGETFTGGGGAAPIWTLESVDGAFRDCLAMTHMPVREEGS